MHGSNGEPLRAVRTGAGLRGRWPRTVVLTAAAALAAIGVAGCQGHSSSPAAAGSVAQAAASGGAASSPAPSGAALTPLAWSAARAPLPAAADGVSNQYVMLGDVSCPAAGYCVAVGTDRASTGSGDVYQGLTETLAGGTWTPATVPDVSSPDTPLSFDAVSCPARGSCVAVGFVRSSTRIGIPLIEQLSGGRWHPVTPPRPGDASPSGGSVLTDISCPAADWCVATGWYFNTSGHHAAYVDTLSGGTWTASAAPLPSGAAADQKWSQDQVTAVGGLGCASASFCIATAGYVTTDNEIVPAIETLSGGTWTAVRAPLPADAAPASGQGNSAYLMLATCPSPSSCLVVGSYPAEDGTVAGMIETAAPKSG